MSRTQTPVAPDIPFALQNDPLHRVVGEEAFVLTRDSQMHWLRNATARFLWEALVQAKTEGMSPRELAAALCDEFEVDEEQALGDVLGFVEHLTARGVLGPSGGNGRS